MPNIIELKKVNKIYGKDIQTQVLFDVNLSVEQGAFSSIIGASGSGKSTLLNLIGTLDKATSGEVFIDGKNTMNLNAKQLAILRNSTIGFIFQFHYLLNEFTAFENVLMPYKMQHGRPSKAIIERAQELLDLVGISNVKNNYANKMSGGQQQRTAIARALINQPKLVLADEPTGNLDSHSSEGVFEIFRNINKVFQTTFLIVTHDQRIAQATNKQILVQDGRIV